MAIKYPGQQKIGYGKAQVFDTSKLAEGARYAAEKFSLKRKEKKKAKDDFVKNLKEIDVSKIRQVDTDYITSQVNAVSEYFYKNSAAILNPKLDGGKAAMEVQRLKSFAVGEVQKSIGIKEEDKALSDKIASDKNHFGTTYNYDLHSTRTRTAMNNPMWDDRETPTTYTEVDLSMTEEERADFYSKSKLEQEEILKGRLPSQQLLNQYQSIEDPKEKQEFLLEQGFELPQYGADGDFGDESKSAESKFLERQQTNIENESAELGRVSDISGYENYQDYQQGVSTDLGDGQVGAPSSMLTEQEFDNLQEEYNRYETTWNESQGTFDVTTEGGETIVGLHNRQIEANPMLGDHIMKVAKEIVPKNMVVQKGDKWQVGEGNVTQFDTKVEADRQSVINALNGSISGHRFNPEMEKELNEELIERQKTNPQFTREDLLVEKAMPYVQYENKTQLIRDIFKPKGTRVNVSTGKPTPDEFAVPLTSLDDKFAITSNIGEDEIGLFQGQLFNFDLLNEGTVNGVPIGGAEISQVAKGEGGQSDVIEVRTSNKGYQELFGETEGEEGTENTGNIRWKEKASTIKLNPQFIFPAPTFDRNVVVNGITFKAGDRIPSFIQTGDGELSEGGSFEEYMPTVNQEGEYEFGTFTDDEGKKFKVEPKYFLQGTIVKEGTGANAPVIIEYDKNNGTVYSAVNSYIQRQSGSRNAFDIMNRNLLGYSGTNRAN